MLIKLYNTDKKELIGIFRNKTFAARYLYQPFYQKRTARISSSLKSKSKIHDSVFSFPVAVRSAAEIELEADKNWDVKEGYPQPTSKQMQGFSDMVAMNKPLKI